MGEEVKGIHKLYIGEEIGKTPKGETIQILREVSTTTEGNIEEPEFKDGDFVVSEKGSMFIYKEEKDGEIYDHAFLKDGLIYTMNTATGSTIDRLATEEEKQFLLDALEKDGKKWNAEKLCIEDIPQRKFKPGDMVKLKDGMRDKRGESPYFTIEMDVFIGKVLTVKSYNSKGYIFLNEAGDWAFAEAWFEPYSDEPEFGELAIFWDNYKEHSNIAIYKGRNSKGYIDHDNTPWFNAVKFESKEQFEKHIESK